MEEHETALVDLCMTPGANDKEMDDCVKSIHSAGYGELDDDDDAPPQCDDEGECLLDDMFNMWSEDLPSSPKAEPVDEERTEAPAARPWSSRSSGSGTYARDPATGEMRNIDAKP